jgi:hypothetical protein
MDCIDFMDTKGGALQGGLGDGLGSGGRNKFRRYDGGVTGEDLQGGR